MSDMDTTELKAGHAPAVKAGGMRIVQNKQEKAAASGGGDAQEKQEEEEFPAPSPPTKAEKHSQQLLIGGVVTKGDRDFPAEAVKATHDKPKPKHENRSPNVQQNVHINQPRK